ncbi:hypothetical protein FV230_04305 [Methylobacterium sp. WL6]|nr:hypothetical protein FV230_04305 [Methylobacterium sp. WL6]
MRRSYGADLQRFFGALMSRVHRENFEAAGTDYSRGDLQCDGRLVDPETIFACYGPANAGANATEASMRTAVAKVRSDFEGAMRNWPGMTAWVFVTNYLETPAQMLKEVAALRDAFPAIKITTFAKDSFERVLLSLEIDEIEDLFLGDMTDEDFRNIEARDIMAVVRDVMANVGVRHELDEPPKPVPEGKLEFNELSSLTRDRIAKGFAGVPMVKRLFADYPDPLVPPDLAAAYRSKYQELELQGLAPGDIMDGLYLFTINGHPATTSREAAVWTVIAYFFEACTIFREPPVAEKAA